MVKEYLYCVLSKVTNLSRAINTKGAGSIDCKVHKKKKGGGERWDCKALFIDGEKGNWQYIPSNFALMMMLGIVLMELGWILPCCWYCKKQSAMAKWFKEVHFADWIDQGVTIHYTRPRKQRAGALSLTIPQGRITQGYAQPIMVVQAVQVQADKF